MLMIKAYEKSTLKDIEKQFGKGAIMKLGEKGVNNMKFNAVEHTNKIIEFIRNYFKKFAPDERVFKPELFNNKLNLHRKFDNRV